MKATKSMNTPSVKHQAANASLWWRLKTHFGASQCIPMRSWRLMLRLMLSVFTLKGCPIKVDNCTLQLGFAYSVQNLPQRKIPHKKGPLTLSINIRFCFNVCVKLYNYRPQTKSANVYTGVCLAHGGGEGGILGLCPGGSLSGGSPSRGVYVQGSLSRGSLSRGGVSVQERGLCPGEGSLSRRGVTVQGRGLCPGEGSLSRGRSLSTGVSVQGRGLCPRVSVQGNLRPGGLCLRGVRETPSLRTETPVR